MPVNIYLFPNFINFFFNLILFSNFIHYFKILIFLFQVSLMLKWIFFKTDFNIFRSNGHPKLLKVGASWKATTAVFYYFFDELIVWNICVLVTKLPKNVCDHTD